MKTKLILALLYVSAFAGYCGTPFPLGWKPTAHGIKAPQVDFHPMLKGVTKTPDAFYELRDPKYYFPTSQGDIGACEAFTTMENAAVVYQKDYGQRVRLSALDIYQQCLVLDKSFPNDNGTFGNTTINVMLKSGALLESTWPYSRRLDVLPVKTSTVTSERAAHRALDAWAVSNTDKGATFRKCIAVLKVPVNIGSYWHTSSFKGKWATIQTKDASGKAITEKRYVLSYPSGRVEGGHSISLGAYDLNMIFPDGSKGGYWIHNHWEDSPGVPWGDELGGAWLPARWVESARLVEDAVALAKMSNPKK